MGFLWGGVIMSAKRFQGYFLGLILLIGAASFNLSYGVLCNWRDSNCRLTNNNGNSKICDSIQDIKDIDGKRIATVRYPCRDRHEDGTFKYYCCFDTTQELM